MNGRGFTLVELVIGMAACAIVALVGAFLVMPADNWIFILERRGGMAEAEHAVGRLVKEIGRVGSPGQISTFTPARLSFTDVDGQALTFELKGTDLLCGPNPLARRVSALAFQYLKGDGTAAAVASEIRVIRVSLAIISGRQTIAFASAAQLKNGI